MRNSDKDIMISVADTDLKMALRTAYEGDLPNLRHWKNEHRECFFFKGEISPEQQIEWFRAYLKRPEDYMFVVIAGEHAIGCMGIRLIGNVWDVYNVILGSADYAGKGLMSKAFQAMLRFAESRHQIPITLKVLRHNAAVGWYQRNGFRITSEQQDHFCMLHQSNEVPTKEAL